MAIDGETYLVHRISFALRHGSTPPHPLVVGHECDVKLCVNPDHLRDVTQRQNVVDAVTRGLRKPTPKSKPRPEVIRPAPKSLADQLEDEALDLSYLERN